MEVSLCQRSDTAAPESPRSEADGAHSAGHHTPSKASWRRFFQAYIEAFDENGGGSEAALALPSPSAGPSTDTPDASGTSTPVPVDTQSGKL